MGTPRGEEAGISRPLTADPETQADFEALPNSEETPSADALPNAEEQAKEASERRKWPRYPDKERSGIWFSTPTHGAQHGRLEDVALGGLSVCVSRAYGLEIGQQVVVGIGNWMIPAKIRNMVSGDNKSYRVGMEWIRPETPAIVGLVERCRDQ